MSVGSTSTGSTNSAGGGTTGSASLEPPHRRLNIIRNTAGGLQIRVIGLFRGDADTLPPTLVRCDGGSGTPDMRGWFARDRGSDSLGTTGGSSTHSHTTPSHSHTMPSHNHSTSVGTSNTGSLNAPSFGDLGPSPTTSHTHSSGNTGNATPSVGNRSSGTTNSVSHIPPFEDVHFVRLEGVGTEPLTIPQVVVSEFSQATVAALAGPEGMDRLVCGSAAVVVDEEPDDDCVVLVCPNRVFTRPRGVVRSTPNTGGLPTVATTSPGQDVSLTIPVVGTQQLEALERVLAEAEVYWAPYGGTPGWYKPAGWTAQPATPRTWTVAVTMVEQPWPATPNPEDLLTP